MSLIVASVLLAAKYQAYRMTGSAAVLSDALESIVNVVAAVFALGGLVFAGRPADRNHPYGHGKIEFFSAAFEGGLIAFASVLVVYGALRSLIRGPEVRQIGVGILIVLASALVNLVLGVYLLRTGRRHRSLTLAADGQHVLADVWTSGGIVLGLGLVNLTGWAWLDPVVALLVALWLMWTGFGLVRHAAGGLLDEEDPALLRRVLAALQRYLGNGIIRVLSDRDASSTWKRTWWCRSSGAWSAPTISPRRWRRASCGTWGRRARWCSTPIRAIASTAPCAISETARFAVSRIARRP